MVTKTKAELREMYGWVGGCSEGLIAVRQGDEEFHVHSDGTSAYEQRFNYVGHFSGGKAEARLGNKHFFIRPDGTRVDT